MRRRAFTLLELTLAILLLSGILGALFRQYKHISVARVQIEKGVRLASRHQVCDGKLHQLFLRMALPGDDKPPFQIQKGLQFYVDEGIAREAQLSGVCAVSLNLNDKEELILTKWPKPIKGEDPLPPQVMPILPSVKKLTFEYYCPKAKKWMSETKEKSVEIPLMIRMTWKEEGGTYVRTFFPPIGRRTTIYHQIGDFS